MADLGHQLTDKELKKLEQQIRKEYYEAQKDVHKKLTAYLEKTEAQRQIEFAKYKNGEISKKDYDDFVYRHNMVGKRWKDMRTELAETFHHSNEVALQMSKDKMPDIFALNANWATYQIEHDAKIDTGFVLYNHDTAAYLLTDKRQLMPGPSTTKQKLIAANKDMQWNERKIQSAVLQGVLQGESPYQVADRLREVGQMNYNASVRYARTMTTSAQNAGRYESYRRAKGLGVDLTVEWQATLDHRTRHHHRQMHGQRTDVDKPFHTPDGYTIYYPADCTGESTAPQKEIWNCRCTLLAWVKGFEGDTVKSSPKMGDMSFEEWQGTKNNSFTEEEAPVIIKKSIADNYYAFRGVDKEFKQGMADLLENCPNEDARALYEKYAEECICNDDSYTGGAYFRASDEGCYFNAALDKKGDRSHAPYENAFHEFGHNIDYIAGGENRWMFLSNQAIDGERLQDHIRWDYDAFKASIGAKTDRRVINYLKTVDGYSSSTGRLSGNISDILEFCTGIDYPLGVGHGADYHKYKGQTEREFFTEVLSSAVTNPQSYKVMKRIFPESVDFVWKMVRSVI